MVTYLYWALIVLIAVALVVPIRRFLGWKPAVAAVVLVFMAGWAAFYFEYEQFFVKNYGGVMTVKVPSGQIHLSATWKDDHLWIENYDPKSNICFFTEYSKGHMLQGQVTIENCNPLVPSKP